MRQVRTLWTTGRGCVGHGRLHLCGPGLRVELGAATFLHESNAVPGRANRLLSRWADEVLVAHGACRRAFWE